MRAWQRARTHTWTGSRVHTRRWGTSCSQTTALPARPCAECCGKWGRGAFCAQQRRTAEMCQGRADGHPVPSGRVVGMKPGHDVHVWTSCTLSHKPPPASAPTSEREHGGGQGRSVDGDGNVEATRGAGQVTTAVTVRSEGPAGQQGPEAGWRGGERGRPRRVG